jgi:hypothetical protein
MALKNKNNTSARNFKHLSSYERGSIFPCSEKVILKALLQKD